MKHNSNAKWPDVEGRKFFFSTYILYPSLLLLLCLTLFFWRLGERNLSSSHEARAAQNAQSILDNDDWLLPRMFDRVVELQKPPLYYWLVAWLSSWQGDVVDAFTTRLPSAIAALIIVFSIYGLCIYQNRIQTGFLSAVILATFAHFTWLARVARIDMPLSMCSTLAIIAGFLGWEECRRGNTIRGQRWFVLTYVATGIGFLFKGPIILLLVGVVAFPIILFWPIQPWTRTFQLLGIGWGLALIFLITAPWFWLANELTDGDLFQVFFWYHNLARGFGGAEELASYPLWYYIIRVPIDFFPWSLLLPFCAGAMFKNPEFRRDNLLQFAMIWFFAQFFLLSVFQFKRADYLLPLYPPVALALGIWIDRFSKSSQWFSGRHCSWVLTGFATIVVGTIGFWIYSVLWMFPSEDALSVKQRLAQEIRQGSNRTILFFRVEDHELAFHVGQPMDTILEWENLKAWLQRDRQVYVIMSKENAENYSKHLQEGALQLITGTWELTEEEESRPLALMRSVEPIQ